MDEVYLFYEPRLFLIKKQVHGSKLSCENEWNQIKLIE